MEIISFSEVLIALLTLTLLEVVLGLDNLIFILILSERVVKKHRQLVRRLGLILAMVMRLALLASVFWLVKLTEPLFEIYDHPFSVRDLFFLLGGIFLLAKGTWEIHHEVETDGETPGGARQVFSSFTLIITQIVLLDMVFSIDSILTAVGLTTHYWIMATAIIIAITVMLILSEPLNKFIQKNPTIKMLALSFLLLVGVVLVADGLSFHIPRGFIYFSLFFSIMVESLNILAKRARRMRSKV